MSHLSVAPTAAASLLPTSPRPRSFFRTTGRWLAAVPFVAVHFSPLLLFWVETTWWALGLCVATYYLRMFGITAGYHRYFSHRSYKMGRVMQFLMAFLAQTSTQKGVLWWAAHHRHHHKHSDEEEDVHSPVTRTILYAHLGWLFDRKTYATDYSKVRDLATYPELRWLNRLHLVPPVLFAVGLFLALGWTGFVWGFLISTVLLWHGTFLVNSATHLQGKRVYPTKDASRNNWWVSLLTLGEGWHNNHHYYQRATAQGWRWYEFDPTYLVLKLMEKMRLVNNVTRPPARIVAKRIDQLPAEEAAAVATPKPRAVRTTPDAP